MKLLNKIKSQMKDLKISIKLMLFYFIILIIAVLISGFIYYNIYSNIMSQRIHDMSTQTLLSVNANIEGILENSINLSKVIITSEEIQSVMKTNDPLLNNTVSGINSVSGTNTTQQRIITSYVSRYLDAFPFITSIYVFDNQNNRFGADKMLLKRPLFDDISEFPWYNEAAEKRGGYLLAMNSGGALDNIFNENDVSVIRMINDIETQRPIGVFIMSITSQAFVESYQELIAEYDFDIAILDSNNQEVVSFSGDSVFSIESILAESPVFDTEGQTALSFTKQDNDRDFNVSLVRKLNFDWTIIGVMPRDAFVDELFIFSRTAFLVIGINSFLLFLGSIFVSRMITNPIKKLVASMKKVKTGELATVDIDCGNNEIGLLRDGYNSLIQEVRKLLDRLVESHATQRQAELNILQAQIKPHFLYNTFDAISSLALSGQNKEVYRIMKALGSYYRTSLSKGDEVITLKEEINVVRNYLTIQQIRYGDIFDIEYDIDEEVVKYKILKLILQPLVENSIYHGIKPKGEKGLIRISAKLSDQSIILSIEDDGVGFSKDVNQILSTDNDELSSFGLRGTIERLKLFYDTQDIVSIDSGLNKGTLVRICIPLEKAFT